MTVFFLPIFFTYTGLRTDIGSLASGQLWLLCGLVLAAAVFGKLVGCGAGGLGQRILAARSRPASES